MSKFRAIFRGKRYVTIRPEETESDVQDAKKEVPDGLWTKCPSCRTLLYNKDLERNLYVCDKCEHHFPVSAPIRLQHLLDDPEAFIEIDSDLIAANPLDFPQYPDKLERDKAKTGAKDAIITGVGSIGGTEMVIAVMEFAFMGGSMGSVVGERITRAFEEAGKRSLPIVTISASGGARMQEGILSLMQMQKTAAAVWSHSEKGLLFISVLTHPTTAGVFGSFASLGDLNIAEPGATVGFAGQRVIEETIRKAVPPNLQKAETVFDNGFIDQIVPRKRLKDELARFLLWHTATAPIEVRTKGEASPDSEDDRSGQDVESVEAELDVELRTDEERGNEKRIGEGNVDGDGADETLPTNGSAKQSGIVQHFDDDTSPSGSNGEANISVSGQSDKPSSTETDDSTVKGVKPDK